MLMNYFLFLLFLLFVGVMIRKSEFFRLKHIPHSWVFLAFGIKLLAAFCLWYIYTYYYPARADADIFKYFDDALSLYEYSQANWQLRLEILTGLFGKEAELYQAIQHTEHWSRNTSELYNDNPTLIRINFLLLFLSQGFYPFHALFFSFISFAGLTALYRFISSQSKIPKPLLFLLLFGFPSVVFWTSGVLKESWLFFSLGFFLLYVFRFKKNPSFKKGLLLLLFSLLLFGIKPYIFLCLGPALLYYFWDNLSSISSSLSQFFISQLLYVIGLFGFFSPVLFRYISQKQDAFIDLALKSGARSLYNQNHYENLAELFYYFPQSVVSTLFRPFVFEVDSIFSGISSIENLFLLLILLLPIYYFRKPSNMELRLVLFSLSFVLVGSVLIGLSTPVLGALVRYKTPLIAFYFVLVLTFVDLRRIRIFNHE